MIKRIFSTSFFSVTSRFFSTGTSLLIIFFISRFMDVGSLGRYGIAFFFFQLFIVTSYFGLEVFLGKEVAHERDVPETLRELFSETLAATLYGSILSLFLMAAFYVFYGKIDLLLFSVVLPAGILYGLERNLGGFLLGKEKVHVDAFFMFLSLLITAALILLFKDHLSIARIFLIRVFSLSMGVTGRIWVIAKDLPRKTFRQKAEGFVACIKNRFPHFSEAKFFWFFTLFTFLERQSDIFILSLFIDENILGGYFLSLRIYLTVNLLIEVVAQALTPFISRVFRGKEAVGFKTFFNYLFILSLLAGIVLGLLLFFTKDFIISLFNKDLVRAAGPFLAVLAFAVPFKVGAYILGSIMSSSQYQKARFYIGQFTTLFFVIALVLLAKFYSAIGAVYARAAFEVVVYVISLIFVYSSCLRRPGGFFEKSPPGPPKNF